MKTRLGFVSNSSTTAFFFMTTPANHERAIAQLTDYERAVANQIVETTKFMGMDLVYVGDLSDQGVGSYNFYDFCLEGDIETPEDASPYEAFDKYERIVKERPEEVFRWSM
jgi:hypothetical protein